MSEPTYGQGNVPPREEPVTDPAGSFGTPAAPEPYAAPAYQPAASEYGGPPSGPGGRGPVPGGVRAATILMYVGAGFSILGGLLLIALTGVSAAFSVFGIVLLALAAAYIYLAVQIGRGNRTARTIAVVLAAVGILFNLLSIGRATFSSLLGIVISGLIIYFLQFQPDAKRFFGDRV